MSTEQEQEAEAQRIATEKARTDAAAEAQRIATEKATAEAANRAKAGKPKFKKYETLKATWSAKENKTALNAICGTFSTTYDSCSIKLREQIVKNAQSEFG